jgi:hypothetical protein
LSRFKTLPVKDLDEYGYQGGRQRPGYHRNDEGRQQIGDQERINRIASTEISGDDQVLHGRPDRDERTEQSYG